MRVRFWGTRGSIPVALDSAGRTGEALPILEAAQGRDPADRDILVALVQFNAKLGQRDAAGRWLDRLVTLAPGDPTVEQLRTLLDQAPAAAPSDGPG